MRLSKIWCFVSSEQINNYYSPKPKAEANNRSAIVLSFSHRVCFLINIFEKLPFSHKSDHKKEKNVVSFRHEQNIIAAKHNWTTLHMSRPLFVGSYLQVTWWARGQ